MTRWINVPDGWDITFIFCPDGQSVFIVGPYAQYAAYDPVGVIELVSDESEDQGLEQQRGNGLQQT